MLRSFASLATVLTVCAAVSAQTTGIPGVNDFTVNGNGSGGTSCVATTLPSGANAINLTLNGLPNQRLILAYAATCVPGSIGLAPGQSVDLDISAGLPTSILDGTGILNPSDPFAPFMNSDATGFWGLSIGFAPLQGGPLGAIQMGMQDPATFTLSVTQAHTLDVSTLSTACGSTLANVWAAGDDAFLNVAFTSGAFTFYGVTYTDCFIGSNGYITFGSGDTDFTDTEAEFLSDQPRIAVWEDYQPNMGGVVSYEETGGVFSALYQDVFNWSAVPVADSNTYRFDLNLTTGFADICIGGMDLAAGNNGLPIVGITPGGGLSAAGSIDYTAGPVLGATATTAIYEDFNVSGVFDLANTIILHTPNGASPGVGPYSSP